jgi:hypothetical protein
MPWKARSVMEERIRFVISAEGGERPVSELCREFTVAYQRSPRAFAAPTP